MSRGPRVSLVAGLAAVALAYGCEEGPFLVTGPTGPTGPVVTTLVITPPALSIVEAQVAGLTLEVLDDQGATISVKSATWASASEAVATVVGGTSGASVTAVGVGQTQIQVTVGSVTAFVSVEVTAAPPP